MTPVPRDLIERYGMPIVTTFPNAQVGDELVKESFDRYAVVFIGGGAAITLEIVTHDEQVVATFQVGANSIFPLHHLTHGTIVNMGYRLAGVPPLSPITVVESFAFAERRRRVAEGRVVNNTPKRKVKILTPTADYLIAQKRRRYQR